uniref:Secreted protein n=1 Tax=Anguilla anguilla TaxID=7936 RepID=A0A0E9TNL2_ANGAN
MHRHVAVSTFVWIIFPFNAHYKYAASASSNYVPLHQKICDCKIWSINVCTSTVRVAPVCVYLC